MLEAPIIPLNAASGSVDPSRQPRYSEPLPLAERVGWLCRVGLWLWLWLWLGTGWGLQAAPVEFNREIRPLLADACFRCHGPDAAARKAGLRLDIRSEAVKPLKSGAVPLAPNQPEISEIFRRISASAPEEVMPPPEAHRPLKPEERELIRRWIAEGAEYAGHWAFEPLRPPVVPPRQSATGASPNGVDAFIEDALHRKQWEMSHEADRSTLIRRVTLDLTGLPPTPTEVAAFLADSRPGAWGRVVDRLLASPHYGERMAQEWLDAARFADSNGYQVDRDREMYAWRDWVVDAFNRNLPFDQFTIEQLAGDLLPNPTVAQRIATGFHRNHMINEEGGIIPEEFLNEYCADRVETTATVWLGLTFNCARCHDHKYDPVTQRDFYGLYAFFHNVTENGVGDYGASYRRSTPPFLKLPQPELETRRALLNRDLEQETNALAQVAAEWEARARTARPVWREVEEFKTHTLGEVATTTNRKSVAAIGRLTHPGETVLQLRFVRVANHAGPILSLEELRAVPDGTTNAVPLRPRAWTNSAPVEQLAAALDRQTNTAWRVDLSQTPPVTATFAFSSPLSNLASALIRFELGLSGDSPVEGWSVQVWESELAPELLLTPDLQGILSKAPGERNEAERKQVDTFRFAESPDQARRKQRIAELRQKLSDLENGWPVTLVMEERDQPRPTFVLKRGAYNQPTDPVTASTPGCLPPFAPDLPRNRLGLARWLMDPGNPLPARVMVNRWWQICFGIGLVRTSEDFGLQGELPTHPELLDWLASEFIRSGWDVKRLMRLLVTSEAYRRDSRTNPTWRARDPENRYLARGSRFRLSAEAIRDQALAASGLLVDRLGGPSVKPYHPPGLYEQVVAGSGPETYVMDHGASLYRRTLYTYWKRSVPNPGLLLFDRPFRETCTVRRARTSTPLQALHLLNDPTYVEAARVLAERMIREGGSTPEARIEFGFRCLLVRPPRAAELSVLTSGWQRVLKNFREDPAAADEWLRVGESRSALSIPASELAAYTVAASTLLNLDEAITKE